MWKGGPSNFGQGKSNWVAKEVSLGEGVKRGVKVDRVKWEDKCKFKREGDLGVKNLRLVSLALLSKWRWKLLKGRPFLWKDINLSRYNP